MFWDNFLFYCNQKGVAPNVAAQSVGIKSSGTVTGWKNGAMPRPGVLNKLAQYFEISVSDLVSDEQKENPAPHWDGLKEIDAIFEQLTPSRQSKLLELARLYLDDQRRNEETQ